MLTKSKQRNLQAMLTSTFSRDMEVRVNGDTFARLFCTNERDGEVSHLCPLGADRKVLLDKLSKYLTMTDHGTRKKFGYTLFIVDGDRLHILGLESPRLHQVVREHGNRRDMSGDRMVEIDFDILKERADWNMSLSQKTHATSWESIRGTTANDTECSSAPTGGHSRNVSSLLPLQQKGGSRVRFGRMPASSSSNGQEPAKGWNWERGKSEGIFKQCNKRSTGFAIQQ